MAKLSGGMDWRGTIHGITFYKIKNLDKIIARAASGPSKEIINTNPNYCGLKKRNSEFTGKQKCFAAINTVLKPLKMVGDFSKSGPINKLLKPVQEIDTVNEKGRRSVLLSRMPQVLHGFNMSKRNPFETVLTHPILSTASREEGKVTVTLPVFMPGVNFHSIGTFSHYQVIITAGIVPDFYWVADKDYRARYAPYTSFPVTYRSEWAPVDKSTEGSTIDISLPYQVDGNDFSNVVAAGISFGLYRAGGQYEAVKGAGCGKIIGVF